MITPPFDFNVQTPTKADRLQTLEAQSKWIRALHAFSIGCFTLFAFCTLLGGLPAGFISVPAGLGFLSGLTLMIHLRDYKISPLRLYEKAGLLLLTWLAITGFWSQAGLKETVIGLEDYHIFLMLPVASWVLSLNDRGLYWVGAGALSGALLSLLVSYMLGFGIIQIEGYRFSLGNRIYHALIMACLLVVGTSIVLTQTGVKRGIGIALALITFANLTSVETGRTGYLIALGVPIGLAMAYMPWRRATAILACCLGVLSAGYATHEKFQTRVNQTIENTAAAVLESDYRSSAGLRIQWWINAVELSYASPLVGRGIGDVKADLKSAYTKGEMIQLTRNVHNEYLHLLIGGGLIAVFLFLGFLGSIALTGIMSLRRLPLTGLCLLGCSMAISIHALFNSTIMNFSSKNVLIVALSILGAILLKRDSDAQQTPDLVHTSHKTRG